MTLERPSQSKSMAWIMGGGAGLALLLLGLAIRSLVMIFGEPKPVGVVKPESVMMEERQDIEFNVQDKNAKNEAHVAQNHEHVVTPIPEAVPASAPQGQAPRKNTDSPVDYQTLREREAGRDERNNTLREIAKENPESGYAMTEEQLRKFEKSGASFQ